MSSVGHGVSRFRGGHAYWLFSAVMAVAVILAAACSAPKAVVVTTSTPSTSRVLGSNAEQAIVPPAIEDPPRKLSQQQIGGLLFSDVTAAAGLTRDHSTRDLIGEDGMTGAVSVVDINSDGLPDVFLGRIGDVNSLYRNNGDGSFTDIAAESGLLGPNPEFGTGPSVFFDMDADGDQDAYMAAVGAESDRMYRNDGSGVFTDVTKESGVFQAPPTRLRNGDQVHGLDVADVDGDGDLDLVVVQWDTAVPEGAATAGVQREASSGDGRLDRFGNVCDSTAKIRSEGIPRVPGDIENRSRLWINNGNGTFHNGTAEWGLPFDQLLGFTPVFSDVNGDRRPDLLVTGDACTSHLFSNIGGKRFEDVTKSSGVGTDENGMGSVVRDLTGDGAPDWFVTSISYPTKDQVCPVLSSINGCSGNRLYVNNGQGQFTDKTTSLGLRNGGWGWGAAIEDFANDQTPDVVMTNGFGESDARKPQGRNWSRDYFKYFLKDPMRFWIRTGTGFTEAATQVGLDDMEIGTGLAPLDYNGDGAVDLIVVHSEGPPTLYRNDLYRTTPDHPNPSSRHWLHIRLNDPSSPGNRAGLGAKVEVISTPGADPMAIDILTGGSYESQKEPTAYFGLGKASRVAQINVYWPGESVPQTLSGIPADQLLEITRVS